MSARIISRFGRVVSLIRNDNSPVLVDGYYTDLGSNSSVKIKASVQPVSSEDLQMLPEGSDSSEQLKIYTIEKLRTRQGNPTVKADRVEIDNKIYEVISVKDYTVNNAMNLSYYMSLLQKVDAND